MSEAFVPLMPGVAKPQLAAFVSMQSQAASQYGSSASPGAGAGPACSKPAVTLQRNGEKVTAIRIQCGCGQVIELNCVY